EIGQRVGRNQATVMRICHRWMQEETTGADHTHLVAPDASFPVMTGGLCAWH
ncbi:hypothetical protein TNCV_687791, partial [Trichonephila clavipes]